MAEHKERYIPFMEYLAKHGFACFINDHRGHGSSVENQEKLGWFGKNGANGLVSDLRQVTDYAKSLYPALPFYLFGHSMGSLAVRCYLLENENQINGLIVCGTPAQNPAAGPGIALCKIIEKLKGNDYRSLFLQSMVTGPFDKPFASEGIKNSWLTNDRTVVEQYNLDPLCGYTFTANGYLSLMELLRDAYSQSRAENPLLPVHFLSGELDPCHGGKANFMNAVNHLMNRGWKNVTWKLYPNMRHEVLNEIDKEKVWEDIEQTLKNWLKLKTIL